MDSDQGRLIFEVRDDNKVQKSVQTVSNIVKPFLMGHFLTRSSKYTSLLAMTTRGRLTPQGAIYAKARSSAERTFCAGIISKEGGISAPSPKPRGTITRLKPNFATS
jgi:hypothetical protein